MRRISRRLVISLAIVLAWLGLIVQGARALLNDSSVIVDNKITSGSVNLVMGLADGPYGVQFLDNQVGKVHNLLPGRADVDYIYVRNDSISNAILDLSMHCIGRAENDVTAYNDFHIEVVRVNEDGYDISGPVSMSLAELMTSNKQLGVYILQGETAKLRLSTYMQESSTRQNVNIDYDIAIVGTQN